MRVSRVCLRAGRILDQHFMPRRTFQHPQDAHLFPGHRHVVLFYLRAHGTPTAKLLVQNNPCRTDPGDRSRAILVCFRARWCHQKRSKIVVSTWVCWHGLWSFLRVQLESSCMSGFHRQGYHNKGHGVGRRFMVANLAMTVYSTFHAQGDVPSPSPKPRAGE